MSTGKELAAFLERVGERVNNGPKGSHRGKHRATFIAPRPLIEGALAHGFHEDHLGRAAVDQTVHATAPKAPALTRAT